MKHFIINIGRQLGSGGRSIAAILAKHYGITAYDRNLIELAAKESGLCKEVFANIDEKDIEEKCKKIAERLNELNTERQNVEKEITESAFNIIEENKLYHNNVIVVYKEGWNHGVIGIVASKISERYYKPCIVLTDDNGVAKGSGRSVSDFNGYFFS